MMPLTPVDNGKGYYVVHLYSPQARGGRLFLIHRLVLSTFSPSPLHLDVNHIDGDKSNNTLSNLEWTTKSENTQHAHRTGLFKNKLTRDDIKFIRKGEHGLTRQQLADKYHVHVSVIGKVITGYLYGYLDDEE